MEPKHADAVSALGLCGGLPGWRITETYPGSDTLNWWYLGLQREVVQAEVDTATEFYVDSYLEDIYMPIVHKGVFFLSGVTHVSLAGCRRGHNKPSPSPSVSPTLSLNFAGTLTA